MIVVDTNILAYYWLDSDSKDVMNALKEKEPDWHVPLLWKSEFRSILIKYIQVKVLELKDAIEIFRRASIQVFDFEHDVSTEVVLHLTQISACSSYDCEFIALAQELRVPLITADKKIVRSFPNTAILPQDFMSKST